MALEEAHSEQLLENQMISPAEAGARQEDEPVCDGDGFPVWKTAAVCSQIPSHLHSRLGLPWLPGACFCLGFHMAPRAGCAVSSGLQEHFLCAVKIFGR